MRKALSKYRVLGPVCRIYRERAELSQNDIAQQLGYESPQLISNFERGLCSLPVNKLSQYAHLTHMPEAVLAGMILSESLYQAAETLNPKDFNGKILESS